ncbi:MAG: AI-2E family transporter [Planctomycetes bacterium]|jgi:predicted PurR-regulated permease PerM|nr:AI-2E family transporter [Planctomycetota bacterium]MCL4729255.1 AI-2E family transporter [Planctomycetota bacterium]
MSRKKKKHHQPQPPRTAPAAPVSGDPAPGATALPAPLRMLDADYSAVLRMRNVRWLIVIAAVVAALLLGAHLSAVFIPLIVALALAYILNPLVVRLQKRGWSRARSVLTIFLLIVVLGAGGVALMGLSVIRDVRSMSEQARALFADFSAHQDEWIAAWNEHVPARLQLDPRDDPMGRTSELVLARLFPAESELETADRAAARAQMATARAELLAGFQRADRDGNLVLDRAEIAGAEHAAMDRNGDGVVSTDEWFTRFGATTPREDARTLAPKAQDATAGAIEWAGTGIAGLFTLLMWLLLIPIYSWYFMVGYDGVVARARAYLPGAHRERIERIAREIDGMLRAFFRGRIIVVLIIGALTTVMYLLFGVKYAVLLGMLAGLGVLMPYASIVVSWIPALILMGIAGDSVGAIIGMSVCFHAIQAVEQYVLTPKLLGDAVELHPVTLLVGVFVMASLFGLFGALLAVPLTAIAKTLGREFLLPYFKHLAEEKPG